MSEAGNGGGFEIVNDFLLLMEAIWKEKLIFKYIYQLIDN